MLINGRHGIVTGLLAALTLGACATQRPTEVLRADGDHHFEYGRFAEAAQDYQEITERYPGDWEAQYMLGRARLELGEVDAARHALEVALTRRPDDVAVADALAEAHYQSGDEDALFAFLRDRARTVESRHAWLRLARYSMLVDDPDTAQWAVETVLTGNDRFTVEPYLVAADLAERLGDRDGAVRRLRQAYGVDPADERVRSRLRAHGEVPGPTIALPPGR